MKYFYSIFSAIFMMMYCTPVSANNWCPSFEKKNEEGKTEIDRSKVNEFLRIVSGSTLFNGDNVSFSYDGKDWLMPKEDRRAILTSSVVKKYGPIKKIGFIRSGEVEGNPSSVKCHYVCFLKKQHIIGFQITSEIKK